MVTETIKDDVYENLPDLLKPLTDPCSGRVRDIVLLSSIGVISSILPKVFFKYNGFDYSSNLYSLIIAPPASGKGVMGLTLKLIKKINERLIKETTYNRECCLNNDEIPDWKCPEILYKIIPANVSCSKLYKHLENSSYGALMFETEADTLSGMFKQEWGNFSDLLRKAYQHEKISMSRSKDDKILEVNHPELAMVLSGTPNQVKHLIDSKENGLFSRFIYYYFDEVQEWKRVSEEGEVSGFDTLFDSLGDKMYQIYDTLYQFSEKTKVRLQDEQYHHFNNFMNDFCETMLGEGREYFRSSIFRHGLIFMRIVTILTILRNHNNVGNSFEFFCDPLDLKQRRAY